MVKIEIENNRWRNFLLCNVREGEHATDFQETLLKCSWGIRLGNDHTNPQFGSFGAPPTMQVECLINETFQTNSQWRVPTLNSRDLYNSIQRKNT